MRTIKILILVISLLSVTFVAPSNVSASISAKEKINNATGDQVCPGNTLNTTLPLPPKGMTSVRIITFDENCKPVIGPVKIVPADQVFTPSQGTIAGVNFPILSDLRTLGMDAVAASYSWTVRADSQMWDCCGIMMNRVYRFIGRWRDSRQIWGVKSDKIRAKRIQTWPKQK